MNKPLLSICCITYNHVNFIEDALKGFLFQRTNFEYEIIINDDASNDGTTEILKKYKNQYADKINLIIQENNQYSQGVRGIAARFTFPHARGKYIALCEGDDYWTDPLKLQKQIDFLEANRHLVGCFHNSEERYWNDYSKSSSLYLSFPAGREFSIYDLTQYNMVPTASIVFKNQIPDELFTKEFLTLPVGDWPLHLLNTRNGNYYYLPQVMSVRNLNPQSVWGMQDQEKNVAQIVYVYNVLIDSIWFKKEVVDLLKTGRDKLENSIKIIEASNTYKFKRKIVNKIIRILNKF